MHILTLKLRVENNSPELTNGKCVLLFVVFLLQMKESRRRVYLQVGELKKRTIAKQEIATDGKT